MTAMRAAQVPGAGGPIELVTRDVPTPRPWTVRVKVEACGVCHSDAITQQGLFPGIVFPRVPGHEVAGVIDAVGPGVVGWSVGQRVGVGWNGGCCGQCATCRRGDFFACTASEGVTGIAFDGGYATSMIAPVSALARIPDALSAVEAAPLLCAGLTTFNALRNCDARPGDLVGILGVGGLGHLGVQFANKMGFRTVAIARGADKAALATKLGAHHYVDSQAGDPAAALQKLGGAKAILATVTNGDAMTAVIGGLGTNGTLLVAGVPERLEVSPLALVMGRRAIKGCYSGTSIDAQDALEFAALTGVRSMNEVVPLARAAEGFERMMSGKARFRVVLTME